MQSVFRRTSLNAEMLKTITGKQGLDFGRFAAEPFRVFFPLGVLAAVLGVALWPLHLWGVVGWYPGQIHARLMANGFFGGFIIGFLGTAMPRMLSTKPLKSLETGLLAVLYLALVTFYSVGATATGDGLMLCFVLGFATCMLPRVLRRPDIPPPGFILVALGFVSVVVGTVLSILQSYTELDLAWISLQRLLSFQGFILFPIMGVAPFILPRFFGMPSPHDFPEMLAPTKAWKKKALLALTAGVLVLLSFYLEALGRFRLAYALRFGVVLGYLILEMPWRSAPGATHSFGVSLRVSIACIVGGFLSVALFPQYRVGLLHLTLMGGFAVITFTVATRVIFGHSGQIAKLKGPNRWLWLTLGLMLLAMATRVSGDLWPAIMATHYIYGALLWIVTALIWSFIVLPNVLIFDDE
jgi:uncharacterized protein involved in response to NO